MRYISTSDRKYYSQLLEFFEAVKKDTSKYKWLVNWHRGDPFIRGPIRPFQPKRNPNFIFW